MRIPCELLFLKFAFAIYMIITIYCTANKLFYNTKALNVKLLAIRIRFKI